MFTYLLINIFSIAIPFGFSFEKRLNFYHKWKYLFPAILLPGLFFLVWDSIFTGLGVWGFNPRYLTGIKVFNLPLEEILFFITIPYACVFTYEVVNYFVKSEPLGKFAKVISWIMILLLTLAAVLFHDKLYTFYTALFTALFLMLHMIFLRVSYLGKLYLTYLIILLPFFIVNGILTGTGLEEAVVWYNDQENLSIRLLTIPIEDSVYGFLLFLMNVTVYEWFKRTSMGF